MSRMHKNISITIHHTESFLILASAIAGCILISSFTSLIGILQKSSYPTEITSSAVRLKICGIAAWIKKYKWLISKAFIDSNIRLDQSVLINNMLKEYDKTKKEIKNLKT